jgi:hypothetical protein
MAKHNQIRLFEEKNVRAVYEDVEEKWYWNKLKERLKKEGNESVTNCHQLKLQAADGKKYKTDVADTVGLKSL